MSKLFLNLFHLWLKVWGWIMLPFPKGFINLFRHESRQAHSCCIRILVPQKLFPIFCKNLPIYLLVWIYLALKRSISPRTLFFHILATAFVTRKHIFTSSEWDTEKMGTYEENICERKYAGMKRDSWFDNNSPSLPNLIMMFLRGIRQAWHQKAQFQPGKV